MILPALCVRPRTANLDAEYALTLAAAIHVVHKWMCVL